jgi:hypothetical protein
MTTQIQITTQDRKLLDFLAKGEAARGGDPYASVFPSKIIPEITQMSIAQIFEFQANRTRSRNQGGLGLESSACGRYQFIRATLQDVVEETGISTATRYNAQCQDFLILKRLEISRGLAQWKSGGISDAQFCLNLAKEFASIPVPITTQGATRVVNPGESYYAGVGSNKAVGHANVSVILQELADIRGGGPGTTVTVDIEQGSGPYPAAGRSIYNQTERSATGGQSLWGAGPGGRSSPNSELPLVTNPYIYKPINPLDNRYDFRTGEIVRDLLHNGVNPVDASVFMLGNGLAPINDLGVEQFTPDQWKSIVESRSLVGYGAGQIDPGINEAIRRATLTPATTVSTVGKPKFESSRR